MDDYAKELRRAQIKKRLVIAGALLVVGLAPCLWLGWSFWSAEQEAEEIREASSQTATEEQVRRVNAAVDAFVASLDARIGPWRETMGGAAHFVPAPELGACPYHPPLPRSSPTSASAEPGSGPTGIVGLTPEGGRVFFATSRERAFDYVVTHNDALPREPALITRLRRQAEGLRERIQRSGSEGWLADTVREAEALESLTLRWDIVVFVRRLREPRVTGEIFDGGEIVANAVLYDYRADTAACATAVEVAPETATYVGFDTQGMPGTGQNVLSQVEGERRLQRALGLVLDDALEREIARTMRYRARPPASAEAPEPPVE